MNHISELKNKLFDACKAHVGERIETIQRALNSVIQSKLEQTKSSAGDKFETGRAMMQIEEVKLKKQLEQAVNDENTLASIPRHNTSETVTIGSLVSTTQGHYLIAIGIGKVNIEGETHFCISPNAPIGLLFIGKKAGQKVVFNKNEITILEVS